MAAIATYVFMDLETTGLPCEENNKTKITELSFVAVKRQHVLDTRPGATPRVQHKLTLCLNPGRLVAPSCTDVTGLCNYQLEYEPSFNMDIFTILNTFLNVLEKPVCLIAHNGHNFDFPILKNHLVKLGVSFSSELLCADCLHGFYDVMEGNKKVNSNISCEKENGKKPSSGNVDETKLIEIEPIAMQASNETTPKRKIIQPTGNHVQKPISKVRRRIFWNEGESPKQRYKLKDIYERIFDRSAVDAHRAENDCLFALECFVAKASDMVKWMDENNCLFSDVNPMTIGVPLGERPSHARK